jgi:hypothetical protein
LLERLKEGRWLEGIDAGTCIAEEVSVRDLLAVTPCRFKPLGPAVVLHCHSYGRLTHAFSGARSASAATRCWAAPLRRVFRMRGVHWGPFRTAHTENVALVTGMRFRATLKMDFVMLRRERTATTCCAAPIPNRDLGAVESAMTNRTGPL